MKNKIVSPAEAADIIRDGDTVSVSGFVGIGTPDELILAIENRFLTAGQPRDLTLVFTAAPGDAKDRGINRLPTGDSSSARWAGIGRCCRNSANSRSTN